jgi:hypothetical protein
MVACNFGEDAAAVELPAPSTVLLASASATDASAARLSLPPASVAVLSVLDDQGQM